MLGLKLSHLVALPALWFKLSKWRSRAQPLYDAAYLEGTELPRTPAANTGNEDERLTVEAYATTLHRIEAELLAIAAKAGPSHVIGDKVHLNKLAHKVAMLAANAEAPPVGPQVGPPSRSLCTMGAPGRSLGVTRRAHCRLCKSNVSLRAQLVRGYGKHVQLLRAVRAAGKQGRRAAHFGGCAT
jgi:hypothetical protein